MDVSFGADIDGDDDSKHSIDDCELHNDFDNQKLFTVYERYLNNADDSDVDEEPELSFTEHINQVMANRAIKTPQINRSMRRITCLADIQKSVPRMGSLNQSLNESTNEEILPWNLKDMNEKEVVELINKLQETLIANENSCPQLVANNMNSVFEKQINFINNWSEISEKKFQNRLKDINEYISNDIVFDELIDKELKEFVNKVEIMKKLKSDLNVIQQIASQ
ncbi:uncharacterized protein LOC128962885 [Oppia nitens]|uniref:uncharacterized protein LOC128962885 n=1 Tax=Oppia nitens TaxID=1686743 RepID=UPI0023DABE84|nr:uncharacterized protein LOC128962885 [Oppia nitens]